MSIVQTQLCPYSLIPFQKIEEIKIETFVQNKEQTQMSPWISILPANEIEALANKKKEKEVHGLIKMLARVTLDSINMYKNHEYTQLDALVGNNGCEVQAFNILFLAHSDELKKECEGMQSTCEKILKWVQNRESSKPTEKIKKFGTLDQIYETVKGMSMISPKMKYLIQSRLLTITKKITYDNENFKKKYDDREYEVFDTDVLNLRKIRPNTPLGEADRAIKELVSLAQSQLSLSSILFMRTELNKLPISNGKDGLLVKKMLSDENLYEYSIENICEHTHKTVVYPPKTYSCNYYNAKALLMLIAELKSPLVIKKMTKVDKVKPKDTKSIAFKPSKEFGQFEKMSTEEKGNCPETPVVVEEKPPVNPKSFAFKPSKEFGQFEKMSTEEIDNCPEDTPVVVCLAYMPELSDEEWYGKVAQYGLGNMILANLSQGDQFVPKKKPEEFPVREPEALQEIIWQAKVNAKEVECIEKKGLLDIDHFYCSNWKKRSDNVGG